MSEINVCKERWKADLAVLKENVLEARLYRWIRPVIKQHFNNLRRLQMMQCPDQNPRFGLYESVDEALRNGTITEAQDTQIEATDIIFSALRSHDRSPVWLAVEVSNSISRHDIERARQSAEALRIVFQQDVLAVVAGYRIHTQDQEQADSAGIHTILVEENS